VIDASRNSEEVLDGMPVTSPGRALAPVPAPPLPVTRVAAVPARQAAALAATGFVAGAAAVAVAGRHAPRWPSRRRRRRKGLVGEIVSSNSFLVDVPLIRRR
jgi:hypothetical protein